VRLEKKLRNSAKQRGISLDAISTTTKNQSADAGAPSKTNILTSFPAAVFQQGICPRLCPPGPASMKKRPYPTIWPPCARARFNPKPSCPAFAIPPAGPRLMPRNTLKQFALKQFARNPNVNLPGKGPQEHDRGNTNLRSDRLANHEAGDSPTDRRIHVDDRRKEARRSEDREVRSDHAHPQEVRSNAARPQGSDGIPSSPLSFLNLTSGPSSSQLSRTAIPNKWKRRHLWGWISLPAGFPGDSSPLC